MKKLLIHLSEALKAKLDAKRSEGYSISGFVRSVLEKEFEQHQPAPKGPKGR